MADKQLTEAVVLVAEELHRLHKVIEAALERCKSGTNAATKQDLQEMETRIMSKISEYGDKVNAAFDEIEAAQTALTTAVGGVSDDVAFLKEEILKLQNTPGEITPEDQAILDGLQARSSTAAANLTTLRTALEALDAATARPTPPTP